MIYDIILRDTALNTSTVVKHVESIKLNKLYIKSTFLCLIEQIPDSNR